MNSETMKKVYLDAQAACGLKVGDYVRLIRQPEDDEAGWDNDSPLPTHIGETGRITDIDSYGIFVSFQGEEWTYPYFVLEKVEKPTREFKPFDKVLTRNSNEGLWIASYFSNYIDGTCYRYQAVSGCWKQCIPYEGNEDLVGTSKAPKGGNDA